MDRTDERILSLLKGNARMSYQDLGDAIGFSRVAAKKRVQKLEREGIIRGYNTCIYREDETTCVLRRRADTSAFASGHSAATTDSTLISHFPFNHNDVMLCHSLEQRVG